jgi:hypothetical protein
MYALKIPITQLDPYRIQGVIMAMLVKLKVKRFFPWLGYLQI